VLVLPRLVASPTFTLANEADRSRAEITLSPICGRCRLERLRKVAFHRG
jgi:hypothetical protein